MAALARGWWALVVLAATGCLSRVDGHCGNNGGEAACGELTPYCDLCTLANDGCVGAEPSSQCRPVIAQAGSSSGDSGSSSGASECSAEGPDAACAAPTPYCAGGTCRGCEALDEGYCATLGVDTPVCDEGSGRCVECTAARPLCEPAVPFCAPDLVCQGCWKHEQCPDSACDLEAGACMPATAVVWVDSGACPGPGRGTENDPFCELGTALALPESVLTVRLRAGSIYDERLSIAAARTIAVRGEDGRPRLTSDSTVINASNGARLYVAGLDVLDGNPAIQCSGGTLWLEDVLVPGSSTGGIVASSCELHVHRTQILDRDGHAIELRGSSQLDLHSSILGLDGTPDAPTHAVYVRDQSRARIVYSTLAGNRGAEASASLACEPSASAELRNSIAVSSAGSSIDCPTLVATHNVVDIALPDESNVEVAALSPAWFVDAPAGDFHVADPEATPFGELAQWAGGDPYEDIDDEPRGPTTPGTSIVGADAP